jgi:hypothetical protein
MQQNESAEDVNNETTSTTQDEPKPVGLAQIVVRCI